MSKLSEEIRDTTAEAFDLDAAENPARPLIKFFLDIETTDVIPGAGIWEIGAVAVVYKNGERLVDTCSLAVKPYIGSSSSDSTIKWIYEDAGRRKRYVNASEYGLTEAIALMRFRDFVNRFLFNFTNPETKWHSWGTFDFPILKEAYRRQKVAHEDDPHSRNFEEPWHYRDEIDLRSVARYFGIQDRPDTSKHEALADAQALMNFEEDILGRVLL